MGTVQNAGEVSLRGKAVELWHHDVIKGVSLESQKGEVIAMLGASGSGKSTFLRCINLLETPNSGDVWLAGEKMRMNKGRDGELVPEDIRRSATARRHRPCAGDGPRRDAV